jgi:hypothetical protein
MMLMQPQADNTPQAPQAPQTGWQFNNDSPEDPAAMPVSRGESIDWTASEYVSHTKSSVWYLQLAAVALLFAAIAYFITKDKVVVATIAVVAIIFGVAAGRKPRVLNYAVDDGFIVIGQKQYPYGMFKSFSIIQEGPIRSIFLMPTKRFNPPMSIYYPPENEQKIVEVIGNHLPQEAREQDAIDRFMHKIRF